MGTLCSREKVDLAVEPTVGVQTLHPALPTELEADYCMTPLTQSVPTLAVQLEAEDSDRCRHHARLVRSGWERGRVVFSSSRCVNSRDPVPEGNTVLKACCPSLTATHDLPKCRIAKKVADIQNTYFECEQLATAMMAPCCLLASAERQLDSSRLLSAQLLQQQGAPLHVPYPAQLPSYLLPVCRHHGYLRSPREDRWPCVPGGRTQKIVCVQRRIVCVQRR